MGIIKATVRQLRRNQTESERIVWEIIRDKLRTFIINALGIKVMRIANEKVQDTGKIIHESIIPS